MKKTKGPNGGAVMSQQQVADMLGLSLARVSQIERRAFVKLRQLVRETPDFPLLADSIFLRTDVP